LILYLDTSALVKLYDLEEGRDLVEQAVDEAAVLTTSSVAYAEARVSLARKRREEVFSGEELREAVAALDEDWQTFETFAVTENVARLAGDLAEGHYLRGFDAIHLATALLIRAATVEEAGEEAEDTTRFLSFDGYLSQEAEKTMRIYETGPRQDDSRQGS
jgi:predicted nucleic acid-binding protein